MKYKPFSIFILDDWLISGYRYILRRTIELPDETNHNADNIELVPFLKTPLEVAPTDLVLRIRHDEVFEAANGAESDITYWVSTEYIKTPGELPAGQ